MRCRLNLTKSIIGLAAALALPAFHGAWAQAEISFVEGRIYAKEVKGTNNCKFMYFEDLYATRDRVSGHWKIGQGYSASSGKIDVFTKKNNIVADMWGSDVQSAVETTNRVGQDLHVKIELAYKNTVESAQCDLTFVLPGVFAGGTPAADKTPLTRITFVEGRVDAKELKGTDYCNYMVLDDLYAANDRVSGTWKNNAFRHRASGNFDVFIKKNKIVADMWGNGVERSVDTTKRVGHDLHVNIDLTYESLDSHLNDIVSCEVAFVLPGVFADDAPAIAVSPSPSPKLSQTSEAQKREAGRLTKQQAESGAAEISFIKGRIKAKELKGTNYCKYMSFEDLYATKDRVSGSWRIFRNSVMNFLPSGKFDVFTKKDKIVADIWSGDVVGAVETTKRVGQDLHVNAELEYKSEIWGGSTENCEVAFVLPGIIADDAPAIAEAPSPSPTLSQTSEAQKREAARLAKQRAEEETRLSKLREEQRIESERLAKLKAEAERRRKVEEEKLRAEAEREQKAGPKQDTAGIGGELKQQLAFLNNLKEEGLIDEQVFKAKESALLNRYLGLKQSSKTPSTQTAKTVDYAKLDEFSDVEFGKYHALVIGINDYRYLPKLKTAVNDAKEIGDVLRSEYGFDVTLLIDPNRLDIIDAFDKYQAKLGPEDNLLIYYAGHGWLNEEVDRGYWLPVNAKPQRRGGWVSNATITDTLKGLNAKHVMVVADSCYSGTLIRNVEMGTRTRDGGYWKRMAAKWARVAITSGGLEPVADAGGGDYSPFAKAFIDALRDNGSVMDGTQLFSKMRRPVILASQQTPQYADVRQAGHDGGDFLFVRRR